MEKKVNEKLRAILGPRLEEAREAVLKEVDTWQGYREIPAYWGFHASAPVVACRNCGLILPQAWKSAEKACLCGKPDPAILVPFSVIPEGERKEIVKKAYEAIERGAAA